MQTENRKSINLLPAFFRTEKNEKFLSSTLDQLISPPKLTRIDGFVGSKDTPNYQEGDQYLPETNPLRAEYQLEPALVVRTLTSEIRKAFALDDLLNQIQTHGGTSSNLDRTFDPRFYSYDPKIDWDKFVNYREYFWLPMGPDPITITGERKNPILEYTITDAQDKLQFLFNGLTTTEQLTLYRGFTYIFNVDSIHNFYIKGVAESGSANLFNTNIVNNGTKKGKIYFTVDWATPERLYYSSNDEQLSTGLILVKDPATNSKLDVEEEILGKSQYTASNGLKFINGLKIRFEGTIYPESFRDSDFIVEGVGKSIKLVRFKNLEAPDTESDLYNSRFDGTNFDQFPFDNFSNIPVVPEYVTINRASSDLNPWSRYNRWFHSNVLKVTADQNNTILDLPVNYRASRPIVEFKPDIQLYNFGNQSIAGVDLVDNITKSAFDLEGKNGYYIDGVLLEEGFRVIFAADKDALARSKVFRVTFINATSTKKFINLIEESDTVVEGSIVVARLGEKYKNTSWHYKKGYWIFGQQRVSRNQAPLFDLYDKDGVSYADSDYYSTNFSGNKIFGYGIGSGVNDPVLGFPLVYRNTSVEGTYLFKNYFTIDSFSFVNQTKASSISTAKTFLMIGSELSDVWAETEPYTIKNTNGVYEVPINMVNNPFNESISEFTLTEVTDHIKTMVDRSLDFDGVFPGASNLNELHDISKYGTRLISNLNSIAFAHHFVTDLDNSIVNSIRIVGENYLQFKFNFIKTISTVNQLLDPSTAVDEVLAILNANKTTVFPYYRSDMLGYGDDVVLRNYKVTDARNKKYSVPVEFDLSKLSAQSVLVYLNNQQLVYKKEYQFDIYNRDVLILNDLQRDDIVTVKYYSNTNGSFVPPTPTKLGLYPAYEPKIFVDDSYASEPKTVIQGHDGSLTVAFDDYRDAIILEYEKRIYNNLKVSYRNDLLDINSVFPGIFRNNEFSYKEILNPLQRDFTKWKNSFNVEVEKNLTFDILNDKTYNYSAIVGPDGVNLPGNWRAIFKKYFDTDRPNTHPWEMLGFSEQPSWWEGEYGPAPYTSGNTVLWDDIRDGKIVSGDRAGFHEIYARPGLYDVLPVDENGNLVSIRNWGPIGQSASLDTVSNAWSFGDMGPAETAWRRSSYWPYAVQIILSLAKPASYASLLFDTSRIVKNATGKYVYSEDMLFISPSRVLLPYDTIDGVVTLASGYSVFVVETGLLKNTDYLSNLKIELSTSQMNLMNKVGGFVSKDKLEVVIDSVNPNSINPGVLLPTEDYSIFFNVSNPVSSLAISGVIIQRHSGSYIIRGYDQTDPYFNIYAPVHQKSDTTILVGAKSEDYLPWASSTFYSTGQVVLYLNVFYRVVENHDSGKTFDSSRYRTLDELPSVGGSSAQKTRTFENKITKILYGTSLGTKQEVVDFLFGYGKYLEAQGFIFDQYNESLGSLLDWELAVKEFLFWTSQNWQENSVITLSPFADQIKLKVTEATVDNVFNSFYEYSLLRADGYPFPARGFSVGRTDGVYSITTKDTNDGLYFARLRLIQKEHAIIMNNKSRFNDVIYDTETGYRQRRLRLIGFRTAEWNGDFFSPGFVYDSAKIKTWLPYQDYLAGDVVEYGGNYYSLTRNTKGTEKFDFTSWSKLGSKPVAQLLPNFDYKINQFEDFYSLDIDNFDLSQQQLAQHLIGYSSRVYLDNIFLNPIAQYKFYQGFISEKGTKKALDKLAKASVHNLQGKIDFNEEWAFRIGSFGAYSSEREIEFPLVETEFVDNSQIIQFVTEKPYFEYDSTVYVTPLQFSIKDQDYTPDTTFTVLDSTVSDTGLALPVAGYVRTDDVDYVFKTKEELLNFKPVDIKVGDTFWIGFDDNGDWGVYRYVRLPASVIAVSSDTYGENLTFTTNRFHGLRKGDIVGISRFEDDINGIYKIIDITALDQFTVASSKSLPASTSDFGILFKFASSRFEKFDDLNSSQYIADIEVGKNIWVDADDNDKWTVYKKIDNYSRVSVINPLKTSDQVGFGSKIISSENSNIVLTSAPTYNNGFSHGAVFVYKNTGDAIKLQRYWNINKTPNQYYQPVTPANFGASIAYDSVDGIIVAGAPNASNLKVYTTGTLEVLDSSKAVTSETEAGLVVISTISPGSGLEKRHYVLGSPTRASNGLFGSSVFIGSTATTKRLLVGAPGEDAGNGRVYFYTLDYALSYDGTEDAVTAELGGSTSTAVIGATGYGSAITGNIDASLVAISFTGFTGGGSGVVISKYNTFTDSYEFVQTLTDYDPEISALLSEDSKFGASIDMDEKGQWLFVSAPDATDDVAQPGKVLIYKNTGTQFAFSQMIVNPSSVEGLQFGISVESDVSGNVLGVTSRGPTIYNGLIFDSSETTFDNASTRFGEYITGVGTAYLFNRYGDKFIYSDELFDGYIEKDIRYGTTVSVNRNAVYVSAPYYDSDVTVDGSVTPKKFGEIYVWQAKDPTANSWKLHRQQENIVNTKLVKQVKTIDTFNDQVLDYLEVFDPIKGRIPNIADQEIKYKTVFDPAIYNIGTNTNVIVDSNISWSKDKVGELWWDMSSFKYVWYEQGDIEYRKSFWGAPFPGCTVDICEWVSSEYLPEEWASMADTPAGLAMNISGQPKYPGNSAYVTEEVYSSITDSYVNVYYFWVKNTVVVPNRQGRSLSAYEVAGLISNPKLSGLKYIEPLSADSLAVINVKGDLINQRISLNIHIDAVDNKNNKHTEWLLIEEGSRFSQPNRLLEKKFIDSLLGKDSLGSPVPDPNLSERQKYGIGIRPRQTMFKDRSEALRNVFGFVNYVFKNNQIVDFYNLDSLTSKHLVSSLPVNLYDAVVEDLAARDTIYLGDFKQAELHCTIENGRIVSVFIDTPGYGYGILEEIGTTGRYKGPYVEVQGTNGGVIETVVDSTGAVIDTVLVSSGEGYTEAPALAVRSYTVVVQVDTSSRNRWARYEYTDGLYNKVQTQSYDTSLYWDYVDFVASDYNQYRNIVATVEQPYQLSSLKLTAGDYVKVKNNGAGRYLILRKTADGVSGTYNLNFDILVNEKGTLKFKDAIWNLSASQFGYDQIAPYDNTLYDQSPDIEIGKILTGLKNDIFIGSLKENWNKLFFTGVKFALTEQKFLDWAFKTSFINVSNKAGSLIQRPVYKFQDTQWYEDYLKEIKPYHTQIRDYKLTYDLVEPSNSFTTDFDLPVAYDETQGKFRALTMDDALMSEYPYKAWADNHTLYLESIIVAQSGSGYIGVPLVHILPATGDNVEVTAEAEAIITSGKVVGFVITKSGKGYTKNPTVVLVGGEGPDCIPAVVAPKMANNKVRVNKVGLKFDRISRAREIGNITVTDTFTASGVSTEYSLTWPAFQDKSTIVATQNGIVIIPDDFSIVDVIDNTEGYSRVVSKLVTAKQYDKETVIRIVYQKSPKIYNAYDRISDYYDPMPGMPGKNSSDHYAQLMKGMDYPGTEIQTLPFARDLNWDTAPFQSILWDPVSGQTDDLDVIYSGGTMTTSTPWVSGHWTKIGLTTTSTPWVSGTWTSISSGGTGIAPEEIILDGDKFISPWRTHAPEELIPGHVSETLGVNIFTRVSSGSPLIYTFTHPADAGSRSDIELPITIPSHGSYYITYDQHLLEARIDYTIDFATNTISVYGRARAGLITILLADIAGIGFIGAAQGATYGTTEAYVVGQAAYSEVKSLYVSVNGIPVDIEENTSLGAPYYVASEVDPGVNSRIKVTVYNLGTGVTNTVYAAFFTSKGKGFSEIREQIFNNANDNNRILTLSAPPSTLGPVTSNSIVEVNGRRIIPPNTTYYEITNVLQTSFVISSRRVYPANSFDMSMLEVYKNGKRVNIDDYYLNQHDNLVIFPANYFVLGDVLAITAIIDYDYIIRGDQLEINNRISMPGEMNYVRVITFTNVDTSYIRTEVFRANSAGLYKLSRQVVNDRYVWVSVGDRTLTGGIDFEILGDFRTIQLDPDIPYIENEQVIILSLSENTAGHTVGFKMFRDTVGRNHFKRLSMSETTYLLQPLTPTDTEIIVENGDALPSVNLATQTPGIVFIAGERIEYLEKNGNVLSKIKRATLGTGVRDNYMIGTWVVDASKVQNLPQTESVVVKELVTVASQTSYQIPSGITFLSTANYHDQIEVYYGGKILEKPTADGVTRVRRDIGSSYSNDDFTVLDPDFTVTKSGNNYYLNLNIELTNDIKITIVQRRGGSWYQRQTVSLVEDTSNTANFLREREAITPDQLYYGGDQTLRLNDGTPLRLDSGAPILGY